MDAQQSSIGSHSKRAWQKVLLAMALLWVMTAQVLAESAALDLQVSSGLNPDEVAQLFNENKWSILRSRLNRHQFSDEVEILAKPIQVSEATVRLSHRDIYRQNELQKTKFLKPLNYLQSHFYVSPNWTLSQFEDKANFSSTIFEQPAYFNWVMLNQPAFFSYSQFKQGGSFYGTFFIASTDFYRAQFYRQAMFGTAKFQKSVIFTNALFNGDASFIHSLFSGAAQFDGATFMGAANFSQAHFYGPVDWRGATFGNVLDLSYTEWHDSVHFNQAVMPKVLDLSYVTKIKENIDLTHVKTPISRGKCKLNLLGANVAKIRFRSDAFELYFPQGTSASEIKFVYESVLKMLEDNGFEASYRDMAIAYKRYQYEASGQNFTNWLQKHGWDYGFDPERIFYWIGVVLLFFTSINALFYRKLVENVMDVPFLARHANSELIERNVILRYVFYFPLTFVFTILLLFSHLLGFRRDFTDLRNPSLWVNVYIVMLICVGVTCSLFVLNYLLGGR